MKTEDPLIDSTAGSEQSNNRSKIEMKDTNIMIQFDGFRKLV